MTFELQADCYAGTWAKSASLENQLLLDLVPVLPGRAWSSAPL